MEEKYIDLVKAVKEYYNDLEDLCSRLQKDYNCEETFEQSEQDRIALCMILDLADQINYTEYLYKINNAETKEQIKEIIEMAFKDKNMNDIDFNSLCCKSAEILRANFGCKIEKGQEYAMVVAEKY